MRHQRNYCLCKTPNPVKEVKKKKNPLAIVAGPDACKCNVCGKIFKNKRLRSYHKRSHKEKTLKCGICPKFFNSSTLLKKHAITHLPDSEKPFQCERCSKTFCELVQKKKHMEKFHESLPSKRQDDQENKEVDGVAEKKDFPS